MSNTVALFDRFSQPDACPALRIPGLTYISQLLNCAEHDAILCEIDAMPWRNDLKRRVQHYGYRYDYKARRVDGTMYLGDLPSFALIVANKLQEAKAITEMPDQLIVNEYLPGQGITAHIDCEPCFGDKIAMVSLGWAYEMEFVHSETREVRPILLATGSAVVISGEARYGWLHQIKARKADRGVTRKRRVSLTFRTVILEKPELRQS
jgi:alkylated DNA repair dioxygenase AlkB